MVAFGHEEHIDHLRQQRNLRVQRNFGPDPLAGPTTAVPVFVKTMNPFRHGLAETQPPRNIGAALTAGLNQFLGNVIAFAEDREDRPETIGKVGPQARVPDHEVQHLRQRTVHELEVALEAQVVRQIELTDPRRVGAAPQILQQQGVVQLAHLLLRQHQLAADVRTDPAAAHAMTGRLPLGHIKGVTERTDQLRQLERIGHVVGSGTSWSEGSDIS